MISKLLFLLSALAALFYASALLSAEHKDPFSQTKFLPDIRLNLNLSYNQKDISNETSSTLQPSYMLLRSKDEDQSGNSPSGFQFNYLDIKLASSVDPFLDVIAVIGFQQSEASIEEAYFRTRKLPFGVQLKGGLFYSSVSRFNAMHAHAWDFSSRPLIHQSLFGDEGVHEIGLQMSWTLPLPFFLQIGAEILQGSNEASFGDSGIQIDASPVNIKGNQYGNMATAYLKTSWDIGSLTILWGVAAIGGGSRLQEADDVAFSGETWIALAEITFKYMIDSYRYVSLQGEYLYRNMSGTKYFSDSSAWTTQRQSLQNSGFFLQWIVKPLLQWRAGLRYELLQNRDIARFRSLSQADYPQSLSAMLEYLPSKFTRFRMQYQYNESLVAGSRLKPYHEVQLQANFNIGAHSAHSF